AIGNGDGLGVELPHEVAFHAVERPERDAGTGFNDAAQLPTLSKPPQGSGEGIRCGDIPQGVQGQVAGYVEVRKPAHKPQIPPGNRGAQVRREIVTCETAGGGVYGPAPS